MRKLIVTKSFILGFISGCILFLCLNYYTVMQAFDDMCFHCMRRFGFPFFFMETGGAVTHTNIFWFSLLADVLIALAFSGMIGLIFKFIWSKFTSKHLALK